MVSDFHAVDHHGELTAAVVRVTLRSDVPAHVPHHPLQCVLFGHASREHDRDGFG